MTLTRQARVEDCRLTPTRVSSERPMNLFTQGEPAMTHHIVSIRLVRAAACVVANAVSTVIGGPVTHAEGGPLIMLATRSSDFKTPLDATPNPDGDTIYFTARASGGLIAR